MVRIAMQEISYKVRARHKQDARCPPSAKTLIKHQLTMDICLGILTQKKPSEYPPNHHLVQEFTKTFQPSPNTINVSLAPAMSTIVVILQAT